MQMSIYDVLRTTSDEKFLRMAEVAAKQSSDPSTKTGCVIVSGGRMISGGYNHFPWGVKATDERLNDRPTKYAMTIHAEMAAILGALGLDHSLLHATLYCWPWPPCANCASVIIECGIDRIVSVEPTAEQVERWGKSWDYAQEMYDDAGVDLIYI